MLLVVSTVTVLVAAGDDIALFMTAVGVGIPLVVVFADLQVGKYFPWSLQP